MRIKIDGTGGLNERRKNYGVDDLLFGLPISPLATLLIFSIEKDLVKFISCHSAALNTQRTPHMA